MQFSASHTICVWLWYFGFIVLLINIQNILQYWNIHSPVNLYLCLMRDISRRSLGKDGQNGISMSTGALGSQNQKHHLASGVSGRGQGKTIVKAIVRTGQLMSAVVYMASPVVVFELCSTCSSLIWGKVPFSIKTCFFFSVQ